MFIWTFSKNFKPLNAIFFLLKIKSAKNYKVLGIFSTNIMSLKNRIKLKTCQTNSYQNLLVICIRASFGENKL